MELWQDGLQVFTHMHTHGHKHTHTHTLGPGPKSNKMDIATVKQPKRKKYKELREKKAELSST